MWRQAVYLTEKAGRGVSRSCFTAWFCTEIGATLKLQNQDFESGFRLGSMLCLMSTAMAPWSFTSALKHQMISNNNVSEHRSLKTGDITDYSASADKGLTFIFYVYQKHPNPQTKICLLQSVLQISYPGCSFTKHLKLVPISITHRTSWV